MEDRTYPATVADHMGRVRKESRNKIAAMGNLV